jgi:ArsR family transcriptional regulator
MSTRARPASCCPPRAVAPLEPDRRERLLAAFRALADPVRLELLHFLRAQPGPTCVCDIVERFDRSQPTISHHLKVLREAGLLTWSRAGIWAFYAPDPEGIAQVGAALSELAAGAPAR